jgi:alcohol dehydrogenase (cytochrome c)
VGTTTGLQTEKPEVTLEPTPNDPKSHVRARLVLALTVAGIILGIVAAAHWGYLREEGSFAEKVAWRVRLFARKGRGGLPELSWHELWQMADRPGGFGMINVVRGLTPDAAVTNSYNSDADVQAGAVAYSVQCSICHGSEGVGGDVGPPLNQTSLKHARSDLSLYKIVRDGIPNTAMNPPPLSLAERWQLVGYIRSLQLHRTEVEAPAATLHVNVSSERVLAAGGKTDEWLTYSGSLDGHRFTPLNQITRENVSKLRILWVRQFDTPLPSIEATPIVANGVMYTTEPPSDTTAVDAIDTKSGNLLWRYARNVPPGVRVCCGRVNRGVAILDNHVYFASLEGFLICLDANSGKLVWERQISDSSHGYSLSMAPLIANRSVVVGIAGAEYTIRGFLAAYDAETGEKQWQFDTVPGPGEPGHETWAGDSWKTGGGSTWVTGSYDPALDLIYWGVGNPSPAFSGDDRLGDNLYTDSAIALHAATGKLAWHFQFMPHDIYDWDSAQTPILAEIPVKGTNRKVLCWPNRNGFYYVLDRATGEFLYGVPFVEQTWAKGLDAAGRPILASSDDDPNTWKPIKPSSGATIFQNATFDPEKKLVFVPAVEGTGRIRKSVQVSPTAGELFMGSGGAIVQTAPPLPVVRALDAGTGARKWEYSSPPLSSTIGFGGLLSTGGGLVFGTSGGYFFALDSTTGREVCKILLGGDTRAAPISFTVDGKQVVAVSAGKALFLFGL